MTNPPTFFSRSTYTGRRAYRNARRLTRDGHVAITNYRTQIAMAIAAVCILVALPWGLRIFMVVAFLMAQDYDWSGLLDKFQKARRNRRAHQNAPETAIQQCRRWWDAPEHTRRRAKGHTGRRHKGNAPDDAQGDSPGKKEPPHKSLHGHSSLNQCFPKVAMKGFDSVHPAVYRKHPEMIHHARADEQAEIEYCRGWFPSLPTDRVKAWEWLAFGEMSPGTLRLDAYGFFCPVMHWR